VHARSPPAASSTPPRGSTSARPRGGIHGAGCAERNATIGCQNAAFASASTVRTGIIEERERPCPFGPQRERGSGAGNRESGDEPQRAEGIDEPRSRKERRQPDLDACHRDDDRGDGDHASGEPTASEEQRRQRQSEKNEGERTEPERQRREGERDRSERNPVRKQVSGERERKDLRRPVVGDSREADRPRC
jgi:hypothetical protein